jgi:hypothetical protein
MSHERFSKLIADGQTIIHEIELSTNSYGEFLFVSTSRAAGEKSIYITFWGLGYHEYRERWITDAWSWYEALPAASKQPIPNEEALEVIHKRQEDIAEYARENTQSRRGKLFELLADLTDEDGALADLEDFEAWFDEDLE